MSFRLPISLLVLSLSSFNGYAGINKWVDENNQIHYSDQPAPPNVKATPLRTAVESGPVAPTASASEVAAPKTLAEREADFRKTQKAKEEQEKKEAKQKEEDRTRQKYCEDARSNLLTLENSSRRISTYDSKGEMVYMDDAARNQRLEEARKEISKHCQ